MPAPAPMRPVATDIVETYLKAISDVYKATAESIGRALRYFRDITIKAPDFAPGLAGYAGCLFSLGWFGNIPAAEVYPGAKQMALRAVAIDDSLSMAHHVLATMNWVLDWNLAAAEREFRRAIELSPSNADAHLLYAGLLCVAARHSDAISEAQYGLRLDPTSPAAHQMAPWIYLHACQYVQAEAEARRTIELYPGALQPHFVLGWAVWHQGRAEEGVAAFEKALSLSHEAMSLAFLGHTYARIGRTEEARRLLGELDQFFSEGHASPIAFVVIYAGLGDLDAAFSWLESAYRIRADLVWVTAGFPGIDPLRSDPRFADLTRRMGILPSQQEPPAGKISAFPSHSS